MTGHQDHPGTGKTLKGDITSKLDLYEVCKACGVNKIDIVDPYDLINVERLIKENMKSNEVCVIIAKRECELLKKGTKPYCVVEDCKNCNRCLKIGCPAIVKTDSGVRIDSTLCVGVDCGLCIKVCPFGSIKAAGGNQ
jgi:indolepyruvate ferredoxin oxidoreductase alpha subunit